MQKAPTRKLRLAMVLTIWLTAAAVAEWTTRLRSHLQVKVAITSSSSRVCAGGGTNTHAITHTTDQRTGQQATYSPAWPFLSHDHRCRLLEVTAGGFPLPLPSPSPFPVLSPALLSSLIPIPIIPPSNISLPPVFSPSPILFP